MPRTIYDHKLTFTVQSDEEFSFKAKDSEIDVYDFEFTSFAKCSPKICGKLNRDSKNQLGSEGQSSNKLSSNDNSIANGKQKSADSESENISSLPYIEFSLINAKRPVLRERSVSWTFKNPDIKAHKLEARNILSELVSVNSFSKFDNHAAQNRKYTRRTVLQEKQDVPLELKRVKESSESLNGTYFGSS